MTYSKEFERKLERVFEVIDPQWHPHLEQFLNRPNGKDYTGLRIAFGGSATNPAHLGHLAVLKAVLSCGKFDQVHWIPSGFSDKPGMGENYVDHIHRLQMAQFAFPQYWLFSPPPGWAKLFIDPTDMLSQEIPTAVRFWMLRLAFPGALIFFFTGSDAITPNKNGELPIFSWHYFWELLIHEMIANLARAGFAQPNESNLLENMFFLDSPKIADIRSSDIRRKIQNEHLGISQEDEVAWDSLVTPQVADYIRLHQLYR